mgnify:CR=1 FL=1
MLSLRALQNELEALAPQIGRLREFALGRETEALSATASLAGVGDALAASAASVIARVPDAQVLDDLDAAVAVGFALAVVLPNAGNIGGGGFMVLHDDKTGKDVAIDFREIAPAKASRDMYLDNQGNVIDGKSLFTHDASGVPGTVAGMEYALKKWGTMPLSKVLEPAIKLADKGFIVSDVLAQTLKEEKSTLGKWSSSKAIFFKNGEPLKSGDLLVQKDLAKSLRLTPPTKSAPMPWCKRPI